MVLLYLDAFKRYRRFEQCIVNGCLESVRNEQICCHTRETRRYAGTSNAGSVWQASGCLSPQM